MATTLEEYEKLRMRLLKELLKLKKQSLLFLGTSVLLIIATVWLSVSLQKTNYLLEQRMEEVMRSADTIRSQKDSLQALSELLDKFRNDVREERSKELTRPPIAGHRTVSRHLDIKVFLGSIVYIHDRENSVISKSFQKHLQARGAIVPAIETIAPKVRFSSSVRYFHKEDEGAAKTLQVHLTNVAGWNGFTLSPENIPIKFFPNNKVPKGQFEVWLDE